MSLTTTAANLATTFVNELQAQDLDNWTELGRNDEIPSGDYAALRKELGDVSDELVAEYKSAFNAALAARR